VNTVTGSTVGIEAGSVTVKGVHGMVSANGISAVRGLILKAGIVEIERRSPIFANGAPDLSQASSGYTAVAGADEATATEYNAETAATYLYFKFTAIGKNNLGKWTEGKQPTCSHSGTSGYYVCGACNTRVDADGLEVICTILPPDPEAHNYDRYVPAENGKHKKMCSYNNVHVVMEFCSGGTATCTEKATCAFCEMSYGWVLYHDFGGEFTEKNDMGHWKICRRAGCGAADDAKAHTGGVTSCEDPYYCTVCGHEYGEAAGHSYTTKASNIKVSEASCAAAEEYLVQCDRCDSIHETLTVEVGESLPHTFGSEWVCGQEGHWHVCFCGARSEPEKHLEKVINQVKATEWKDGYTGDICCEICSFEVVKGVSVPAFGSTGADNGEWLAILCVILLLLSGLGLTVSVVLGIRNKRKAAQ